MRLKTITRYSEDIKALEKINEEAIPTSERNTLDDMLSTGAELIGIYAENEPIGFLVIRKYKKICYLAYFTDSSSAAAILPNDCPSERRRIISAFCTSVISTPPPSHWKADGCFDEDKWDKNSLTRVYVRIRIPLLLFLLFVLYRYSCITCLRVV